MESIFRGDNHEQIPQSIKTAIGNLFALINATDIASPNSPSHAFQAILPNGAFVLIRIVPKGHPDHPIPSAKGVL